MGDLPTVARFAVAGSVTPAFVHGISFAERLHGCLVDLACKGGTPLPVLTGYADVGQRLEGHGHAHVLFEANDVKRRTVSHVTLYAPSGFSPEARRVLERLRLLYGRGGHDIQLVMLGIGKPQDFAGSQLAAGQCPFFACSRTWVSRTPFVPTRHPKTFRDGRPKLDGNGRQVGSPEHDLLRLLGLVRPELEPPRVSCVAGTVLGSKDARWLEFRTTRYDGDGRKGDNRGYGFRLEFDEPVEGPIVLGYGAHFGLGTFWPEKIG